MAGGCAIPSIFISYRREDTAAVAGRLAEDLTEKFGRSSVFLDIDSIPAGIDFGNALTEALDHCRVTLVLIGGHWLSATLPDGTRRLDHEDDLVRKEVAAALGRSDVHVVPVLVEGARMPSSAELPSDISSLSMRNAAELSNKRWSYDVGRLIATANEYDTSRSRLLRRLAKWARRGAPLAALAAVAGVIVALTTGGSAPAIAATARITEPHAYPDIPLQNYLDTIPGQLASYRGKLEAQGLTASELKPALQQNGVIATFALVLKGPVGTVFDTERTLFRAPSNARVPEGGTSVPSASRYVLHKREESFVYKAWLASPGAKGESCVAELVVLDAHRKVLTYRDTSPFRFSR